MTQLWGEISICSYVTSVLVNPHQLTFNSRSLFPFEWPSNWWMMCHSSPRVLLSPISHLTSLICSCVRPRSFSWIESLRRSSQITGASTPLFCDSIFHFPIRIMMPVVHIHDVTTKRLPIIEISLTSGHGTRKILLKREWSSLALWLTLKDVPAYQSSLYIYSGTFSRSC